METVCRNRGKLALYVSPLPSSYYCHRNTASTTTAITAIIINSAATTAATTAERQHTQLEKPDIGPNDTYPNCMSEKLQPHEERIKYGLQS
jgi:hypothetical protein